MFCPQAPELLDRLLASVRVQRLLSSPLPSPPPLHRGARRLSRSEGDLYCVTGKENIALGSPRQHHNFLRHKAVLERSHSSSRTSATSDDYVQAIGGKVTMVLGLWWAAGPRAPKAVSGPRGGNFCGPPKHPDIKWPWSERLKLCSFQIIILKRKTKNIFNIQGPRAPSRTA